MKSIEPLMALRKDIALRGWTKKATAAVISELIINLSVALTGMVIFIMSENLLIRACAILLSTAGSMGVSTNTHTSSHYATSNKAWLNELLTYFGYPLFVGLTATFWWHKHVAVHHPAPNVMGVDEDADLLPWFAMTREEIDRTSGFLRFYYEKLQWWLFPVALALNGFNMQKSGWLYLIYALRNPKSRRKAHWFDLATMTLHYSVWIIIPCLYFPFLNVVGFYALRTMLMGYAMYAVLGPGHFAPEAARLKKGQEDADYLLLQTAATVNFRTGRIGRLVCSGLEYQIEHHLFPDVSHVYYPKLSEIVRRFCEEHGLPYRSCGWGEALWKTWNVLRNPRPVEAELARLAGYSARQLM